jgi:hypothetical protein
VTFEHCNKEIQNITAGFWRQAFDSEVKTRQLTDTAHRTDKGLPGGGIRASYPAPHRMSYISHLQYTDYSKLI